MPLQLLVIPATVNPVSFRWADGPARVHFVLVSGSRRLHTIDVCARRRIHFA